MSESELYPGLDAELEAVYQRNVAEGRAKPAEEVAISGLEEVIDEQLKSQIAGTEIGREEATIIYEWADPQLKEALDDWRKYGGLVVPGSTEDLGVRNPNFPHTMKRLYEAKQALDNVTDETPEGTKIGETMHLLIVPWQAFKEHLGGSFESWLGFLRSTQGINNKDYINDNLKAAIEGNKPFYRDPQKPDQLLTAEEYLDRKISEDGPWGVMLVQTSDEAGIKSSAGKSPDQMTANGTQHLKITRQDGNASIDIDSMGVFEWLALTLQNDPRHLSSKDVSWLLANRMDVGGTPRVPLGGWVVDRVGSDLDDAGYADGLWRPRLAVM